MKKTPEVSALSAIAAALGEHSQRSRLTYNMKHRHERIIDLP